MSEGWEPLLAGVMIGIVLCMAAQYAWSVLAQTWQTANPKWCTRCLDWHHPSAHCTPDIPDQDFW